MSSPATATFIVLSPEQFITLIVSIVGAAIVAIYRITRKITQLEEQVKNLRTTEMNNLNEKANSIENRCRYIEEKFMDLVMQILPEVRKEIKKEEEKSKK